jgi:alkanesulfonate monooxygenase SsuD/methylene tetrahydromethanopterin reductase-like flavin-dependent oxidoreductase (luciferase family)
MISATTGSAFRITSSTWKRWPRRTRTQGTDNAAGHPFTDWPDPWVLVGALAQATTRLHFVTTVYIPAMRDPYSVAKAVGTAAYLAGGRVELGIGVGWSSHIAVSSMVSVP